MATALEPGSRYGRVARLRRSAWVDVLGASGFVAITILLAMRIDTGVDFGDESYYALFIDDWLKGGIDSSAYRVVHATAALVVYPFAWLFAEVTSSIDGMFLFLRALYLAGSALAALVTVLFLRRLGLRLAAWTGGSVPLAFIPFGLPAPSYNTIGLQASCVALATYGIATCATSSSRRDSWLLTSAAAWSVAVVAYPSLIVAVAILAGLTVTLGRDDHQAEHVGLRYAAMLALMQVLAWSAVVVAVPIPRLWESLSYQTSIQLEGGLLGKLGRGADLLAANWWFTALCVSAVAVGALRRFLPAAVLAFAPAAIVLLSFAAPAALYVRSHDVITLLALSGLGLAGGLRRGASPRARTVATLFVVSFLAGGLTMLSATHLLYNFCIGAMLAAALATSAPDIRRAHPREAQTHSRRRDALTAQATIGATGVVVLVALMTTSLGFRYGEIPPAPAERTRITDGFFAGIETDPRDIELLSIVQQETATLLLADPWVVYIGRAPGTMLATSARLRMRSSFSLSAGIKPEGATRTAVFYGDPQNRAPTVIIYRDPYLDPINPIGPRFEGWYTLLRSTPTPLGTLEIYQRR